MGERVSDLRNQRWMTRRWIVKSDVYLCMEMNVIMDRQANYIACEQASTPTHTNANTQCRHIQQPRYDTILVRGEIKFVVI